MLDGGADELSAACVADTRDPVLGRQPNDVEVAGGERPCRHRHRPAERDANEHVLDVTHFHRRTLRCVAQMPAAAVFQGGFEPAESSPVAGLRATALTREKLIGDGVVLRGRRCGRAQRAAAAL